MKGSLRKLRGALGLGFLMALASASVGAIVGSLAALVAGRPIQDAILAPSRDFGLAGFITGLGFAGLLALMENRRTIDTLSEGRVAAWGGVAGGAVATTFTAVSLFPVLGPGYRTDLALYTVLTGALFGALSARIAVGTLRLARRPTLLS